MAKVFISYRRADSATISGRIYDRLIAKFGRRDVFKDVNNIHVGVHFGTYIQESLRQCAIALVIIGPGWLDARTVDGERRLDDPLDGVRIEVETAFAMGLRVIPVLVDGAEVPKASSLPASLQDLTQIISIQVRNDPDFSRDIERLVPAVEQSFNGRSSPLFGRQAPASPRKQTPPAMQPTTPELGTEALQIAPAPIPHPSATARPARRGALWFTGVAAVLVVATLGALLVTHLPTTPRRTGAGMPTATATATRTAVGQWHTMKSPTTEVISAVAMVSASEGWAVGLGGTVLHYTTG
jgi:TIR domain-containing protein